MNTSPKKSAVTRVNDALRAAKRGERLVRGRGYYYVRVAHGDDLRILRAGTSIYTFHLGNTEADFRYAAAEVNDMFARVGIDFQIPTTKKGK